MTDHLDESIMKGTRLMSGSAASSRTKRVMAASESSRASSMLMSRTCAPLSTCWRADLHGLAVFPSRTSRAKRREPVTLVRSPTLTKRLSGPMSSGFEAGQAGAALDDRRDARRQAANGSRDGAPRGPGPFRSSRPRC